MTTSLCLCRQGLEGNESLSKVFPASSLCSLASRFLSLTAFAMLPVAVMTRTVTVSYTSSLAPCCSLALDSSLWVAMALPTLQEGSLSLSVSQSRPSSKVKEWIVASQWSGGRSGVLMQMRALWCLCWVWPERFMATELPYVLLVSS